MPEAPVIAVDGPTASGKGTIAERVAASLGWRYLDSGALYRIVALEALRAGIDTADGPALAALAQGLAPRFEGRRILVGGEDVTEAIRAEEVGIAASRLATQPLLRAALLALQRRARAAPGLVADGRDMGTVVFPDAILKVYLTASVESRAARRHKQLMEKGFSATIADLSKDLAERDARDMQRAEAPLKPAEGALVLDSTHLSIDETVDAVLGAYRRRVAD
ncbi:(d)CMP kinase [Quisquiliibacterium transsilvanicum]|uniref:Cytidylate kinase n=1 Tax=Quisquiliibacterium transsilvanicum TaxID=1549638 RepID=A0A7W8HGA2_9BURK|nr:(d)CMP kinase [Quisquiliibacterium transsilvanicum]MBB5270713.1 cytidylate kinase [Quisquiliibacterium transsilvanicum]